MSSNVQKAQQLMAEAEKKVSSRGFFGSLFGYVSPFYSYSIFIEIIKNSLYFVYSTFRSFLLHIYVFSGSSRIEDAVECYQRAANLFKMAKSWDSAGKAFCEAANLHSRSGARHDAATNYVDAANCYKKADINGK